MPVAMERPRRIPVSAIAYRTQLQNVKMAACFTIKNPEDAPIYVTGLSTNNSPWPHARPQAEGPAQTPAASLFHNRRHSDKSLELGSPTERYRPVLAVTRRSLPTASNQTTDIFSKTPADEMANEELTSTDRSRHDSRENISKRNAPMTLGRPVPPGDILKSKYAFVSGVAAAKSRSSLNFLGKSKVDLRTGFMRSLSKPTPGELDLKFHRDSQENSAKARREREGKPDLDKLNMSEIMRMLKSKSAVEKRTRFQDTTPSNTERQKVANANETAGDGANALKDDHYMPPRKANPKDSLNRHTALGFCEPPLVSRHRNRDHKLRLQALYSQYHQYEGRNGSPNAKSYEHSKQGRTSKDHGKIISENVAKSLARQTDHEKRMRVNILTLESFGDDGDFTGADVHTSSSESCSEYSSGSNSGERYTPRSTAALLLQPYSPGEQYRQCQMCNGAKSGTRTRSSRGVRCAKPVPTPSPDGDVSRGRVGRAGKGFPGETGTIGDLEPQHHKIRFAEYISITHPIRPPANSPVSIFSEDEDELMNTDDRDTSDQWSMSYRMKRAPTAASSVYSGLVKGQVRVESHGANKATINVFLPQMTCHSI